MNEGRVNVDLEKMIGNLYIQLQGQAHYILELQTTISELQSEIIALTDPAMKIAREAKEIIDRETEGAFDDG